MSGPPNTVTPSGEAMGNGELPERAAVDVAGLSPHDAAALLERRPPEEVAAVLASAGSPFAQSVLDALPESAREAVLAAFPEEIGRHWRRTLGYPADTVGRLMDAPVAVFRPEMTIGETVAALREVVRSAFVTYGFTTDASGRLQGVVVMRDLLLGRPDQRLDEIMIRQPFSLRPETPLTEAMKQVLNRHYPVYPVADAQGRLVGLLRGQTLFEAQAIEISAMAGSMVGVEKEERLSTPWPRSLRLRHPWLQLNLLTSFLAAGVVGLFQDTINRIVLLAVFLPVLSGQSGNTGGQTLAVALRGLALGELRSGQEKALVVKEALLGLLNGALVGLSAGVGMLLFATLQKNPAAWTLAFVVSAAMTGSCLLSGVIGSLIPLLLRRIGTDPAMASSILLTTATDVASIGLFLGMAAWFVR